MVTNADLDAVFAAVRAENATSQYDVNDDQLVNESDLDFLLREIVQTSHGDVDLDGRVAFNDFLFLSSNYERQVTSRADGDLNGDGLVDFTDFLLLSADFGEGNPHSGSGGDAQESEDHFIDGPDERNIRDGTPDGNTFFDE